MIGDRRGGLPDGRLRVLWHRHRGAKRCWRREQVINGGVWGRYSDRVSVFAKMTLAKPKARSSGCYAWEMEVAIVADKRPCLNIGAAQRKGGSGLPKGFGAVAFTGTCEPPIWGRLSPRPIRDRRR